MVSLLVASIGSSSVARHAEAQAWNECQLSGRRAGVDALELGSALSLFRVGG